MPTLDPAIAHALSLDASSSRVEPHGGSSFASTFKISTPDRLLFMKTGRGPAARTMFAGEHESLNAIHNVDASLSPKALAHGELESSPGSFFLVTEFIHLGRGSAPNPDARSLAAKLAKLHTTKVAVLDGVEGPFGFPVTTCCGNTPQPNEWTSTWSEFYATRRLRFIVSQCKADKDLSTAVERTAARIVPRLLGDLNIVPVVTHGDLWSGNKGTASFDRPGAKETTEHVVFDPACCYGHSEYDLGMMKMFGGFNQTFYQEYHQLVPKQEPVDEFDDRVELYEL